MTIAAKVNECIERASWIRKMFEEGVALRQQYGADQVFDFTLGNPTVEPPAELHKELKKIAESPAPGMHRYKNNAGYDEKGGQDNHFVSRVEQGLQDDVQRCSCATCHHHMFARNRLLALFSDNFGDRSSGFVVELTTTSPFFGIPASTLAAVTNIGSRTTT